LPGRSLARAHRGVGPAVRQRVGEQVGQQLLDALGIAAQQAAGEVQHVVDQARHAPDAALDALGGGEHGRSTGRMPDATLDSAHMGP
jgi:uncharacterized protein YjbJ (UPF0337 family)